MTIRVKNMSKQPEAMRARYEAPLIKRSSGPVEPSPTRDERLMSARA
jgi:hypothetical protein